MTKESMDVSKVVELLNAAVPLQFRSAAVYTWVAGSMTGIEFQALGQKFEDFGRLELDDARRLIEKMVALGGAPKAGVRAFDAIPSSKAGIKKLIDYENETLDALHAVIPHTGQEARSEALEHLLEHIIMRKQEQVDFLERVRQGSSRG